MRELMFARAFDMLSRGADDQRIMLLPLGLLCRPDGLLEAFKAKGAAVAARA